MKSSVSFSAAIPRSCQQSWNEMTPSGSGKHCSSCQKQVIDFSILTDAEIISIFSGASQKICGRFNASQLNRVLDKPVEKSNTFPAVVLTTLLVMNSPAKSSASPVTAPFTHAPFAIQPELSDASISPPCDTVRIITGQLTDSLTKDGLPAVTVIIKGTSYGTTTNATGHFRLPVPDSLSQREITLVFAFVGFNTKELVVKDNGPLKIELNGQDKALLGEVVVTCKAKASFRERVKATWRRLWGK
jgi:CarboxypepD_reg-like domain